LIVLDSSAAICLLLNSPPNTALRIRQRLFDEVLHAPHLIDLEIAQTLRRLTQAGTLPSALADAAITSLGQLPLIRYSHYPLLQRIWSLRANVTPYDASYVALAEFLGAPLLTLDGRLARSGAPVTVELY
jgi:predicted nucleic acid-binding protein